MWALGKREQLCSCVGPGEGAGRGSGGERGRHSASASETPRGPPCHVPGFGMRRAAWLRSQIYLPNYVWLRTTLEVFCIPRVHGAGVGGGGRGKTGELRLRGQATGRRHGAPVQRAAQSGANVGADTQQGRRGPGACCVRGTALSTLLELTCLTHCHPVRWALSSASFYGRERGAWGGPAPAEVTRLLCGSNSPPRATSRRRRFRADSRCPPVVGGEGPRPGPISPTRGCFKVPPSPGRRSMLCEHCPEGPTAGSQADETPGAFWGVRCPSFRSFRREKGVHGAGTSVPAQGCGCRSSSRVSHSLGPESAWGGTVILSLRASPGSLRARPFPDPTAPEPLPRHSALPIRAPQQDNRSH